MALVFGGECFGVDIGVFFMTPSFCLALAIFWESGSSYEPVGSQLIVANVIVNRAANKKRGVCHEVFRRKQFSAFDHALDEQGRLKPEFYPEPSDAWDAARTMAREVLDRKWPDITQGATYYHADYVRPRWAEGMIETCRYGRHIAFRKG